MMYSAIISIFIRLLCVGCLCATPDTMPKTCDHQKKIDSAKYSSTQDKKKQPAAKPKADVALLYRFPVSI